MCDTGVESSAINLYEFIDTQGIKAKQRILSISPQILNARSAIGAT